MKQSDTASCMSTDAEGRVVSVGANLERVPTHVIDALQGSPSFQEAPTIGARFCA